MALLLGNRRIDPLGIHEESVMPKLAENTSSKGSEGGSQGGAKNQKRGPKCL